MLLNGSQRRTSILIPVGKSAPVLLLREAPRRRKATRDMCKYPYRVGTRVWARRENDGTINVVPFVLAAQGLEILEDAIEGLDFEFDTGQRDVPALIKRNIVEMNITEPKLQRPITRFYRP